MKAFTLILLAGCAASPGGTFHDEPKSGVHFEEKLLSTIPEDRIYEGHAAFARNGSAVAFIVNNGGKERSPGSSVIDGGDYRVIFNNKEGEAFRQISGSWGLAVSAGGCRVGYTASDGERLFGIVGDQRLGRSIGRSLFEAFSPDGKTFAYWSQTEGQTSVMVGAETAATSETPIRFAGFGPDAGTFAVITSRFERVNPSTVRYMPEYKYTIRVGNHKGAEYDWIEGLVFSPDGKRFAYTGHLGRDPETRVEHMVVNDVRGPAFRQARRPVFSPDGSRLAYAAWNGKRLMLLLDDKDVSSGYAYADFAAFSPDGKTLSYMGNEGEQSFIIVGERRWPILGCLTQYHPVFSPDGRNVAYVAYLPKGGYVGLVGQERLPDVYDEICSPPVFSADSRKVAYGARKGREFWWKVIDVR